jgi:hypothetical protein
MCPSHYFLSTPKGLSFALSIWHPDVAEVFYSASQSFVPSSLANYQTIGCNHSNSPDARTTMKTVVSEMAAVVRSFAKVGNYYYCECGVYIDLGYMNIAAIKSFSFFLCVTA